MTSSIGFYEKMKNIKFTLNGDFMGKIGAYEKL